MGTQSWHKPVAFKVAQHLRQHPLADPVDRSLQLNEPGGLLYSTMWFGTALGVSAVTAVVVIQGQLTIDSLRSGLIIPAIVAVLAAVITGTVAVRAGRACDLKGGPDDSFHQHLPTTSVVSSTPSSATSSTRRW